MCSSSVGCDTLQAIIVDETKTKECVSCKQDAEFVVRKVNGFCRSCYLEACRHKFRSTIGKTRFMKPNDKVLVWLNSPLGASAIRKLLEELKADQEVSSKKKLQFEFKFVVVDGKYDTAAPDEEFFRIPYPTSLTPQRNATLKLFHEALLLQKSVIELAKTYKFNKVFTCDTGRDLASLMLTCVSLGRGGQLPDWTGVSLERDGITLLRPLREFTEEELEVYLTLHKKEIPPKEKPATSIQRLTQDFVDGLQANFPSTVPTIWRTSDKIANDPDSITSDNKCDYCGCYSAANSIGAMQALQVSAELSTTLQLERSSLDRCHACRHIAIN